MSNNRVRVVGLDASTSRVGLACIEVHGSNIQALDGSLLKVSGRSMGGKLSSIHLGVEDYLSHWSPAEVALEDVFAHTNLRTAVVLARVSGVIILLCHRLGLPLHLYPPATVKSAVTRKGNATKEQVRYLVGNLLGLREVVADDVSDAFAVAICHAFNSRELIR